MNDTSFISHRMFVAALDKQKGNASKLRLSAAKRAVENGEPPGRQAIVSPGKEVMASALVRHALPRPAATGM